jgi:NAD(P)-dependent dehydrogenase (short-subunit alcohol dehydrogenase family)
MGQDGDRCDRQPDQEDMMATALVTGANRGIGLALTRALLTRGDEVVAVCRNRSAELEALGARIEAEVDMREQADLQRLAERLAGTRISLLIVNAGVLARERLGALDDEAWDCMRLQFEVNALGALRTVDALSGMLGEGSRIGLITSRMGSIADNSSGGHYGYRMSKAALNAAGRSLAIDLRPRGIAVALLHPGYVRTDMTGGGGDVEPDQAAANLLARLDALDLAASGSFLHANGEPLPW